MQKYIQLMVFLLCGLNLQLAAGHLESNPKVALVLSGGGARSAAHIGVIEVLEELGLHPDLIVGTSMGAVIGGLYAVGVPVSQIRKGFIDADWESIYDPSIDRDFLYYRRKLDAHKSLYRSILTFDGEEVRLSSGILEGQELYNFFKRFLLDKEPIQHFDNLQTPFRAIATDIVTGKAVILEKGDLALAMLSSMAVPGLISPVKHKNQLLVDGGVSLNLPIEVAKALGADIVIAVNSGTPLSKLSEINGAGEVVGQITNILTATNVSASKALLGPQDVLIEPNLAGVYTTEFDGVLEAIQSGKEAAIVVQSDLIKIPRKQHPLKSNHPINFKKDYSLVMARKSEVCPDIIKNYPNACTLQMDNEAIINRARYLYGLDIFERVLYSKNGYHDNQIEVSPMLRRFGSTYIQGSIELESDLDGENSFALIAGLTNRKLNSNLGEIQLILKLGEESSVLVDLYQPLTSNLRWFAHTYASYGREPLNVYFDFEPIAKYVDYKYQA